MITKKRAQAILESFTQQKILVVGDLMLDRYVWGTVNRISPEAPVPVVRVTDERSQPGGAANVALNIQSLGGQSIAAGIVGDDAGGNELVSQLTDRGISAKGVIRRKGTKTTEKTRVVAERQQVVRVDREDFPERIANDPEELCEVVRRLIPDVSAVILEDYGKGAIAQEVVDVVLKTAGARGIPVGLDPKDNHELRISGLTVATPNYREAYVMAGLPESALAHDPSSDERLPEVGRLLLEKWGAEFLIVTLGPHGMCLLSKDKRAQIIPAKAREVFDVSGAGDTVIAVALLALASGAGYDEATWLANHAAGVVVGKLGTAVCLPDELLASME